MSFKQAANGCGLFPHLCFRELEGRVKFFDKIVHHSHLTLKEIPTTGGLLPESSFINLPHIRPPYILFIFKPPARHAFQKTHVNQAVAPTTKVYNGGQP